MAWVRLTPQRATNKKLRTAGFAARGLDEAAMCQVCADMTDGHISRDTVTTLARFHGEKRWERLAALLVAVGRWEPEGDGWHIHDYLEFNWSKERLEAETAKKRDAGRKGGHAKAQADAIARATADASDDQAVDHQKSANCAKTIANRVQANRVNPCVETEPTDHNPHPVDNHKHPGHNSTTPDQALAPATARATADAMANVIANSTQLSKSHVPLVTNDRHDNPKDDQDPDNPNHPPGIQALIDRWLTTTLDPTRRTPRATADANRWIPHLATIIDHTIIDERIGKCALDADQPPRDIKYLIVSCRDWARHNNITITDPPPPADRMIRSERETTR